MTWIYKIFNTAVNHEANLISFGFPWLILTNCMLGNCKSFKKERNWISQVEIAKYLMVNVIRDNHKLYICSTQLPKKKISFQIILFLLLLAPSFTPKFWKKRNRCKLINKWEIVSSRPSDSLFSKSWFSETASPRFSFSARVFKWLV